MRITASDWYRHHTWKNCEAEDCERYYCAMKTHRLLYRTCESVKDWADDGVWWSGECPACHHEYEMKQEIRQLAAHRRRYGPPLTAEEEQIVKEAS